MSVFQSIFHYYPHKELFKDIFFPLTVPTCINLFMVSKTEYHILGCLKIGIFLIVPKADNSKIKAPADLEPGEGVLPGSMTAVTSYSRKDERTL